MTRLQRGVLRSIVLGTAVLMAGSAQARPHSPWVFRSVLDGQPRMITIALHEDLWVAYDATDGRLYQAWRGGVEFDGAVYTTRHGPQPTSVGAVYGRSHALPNGGWSSPSGAITTRYLGYLRDGDASVTIRTRLMFDDGSWVVVQETPEFAMGADGRVKLVRTFRFESPPPHGVSRSFRWGQVHDRGTPATEFESSVSGPIEVNTGRPQGGPAWVRTASLSPHGETRIEMTFAEPTEPTDD